MGGALKPHNVRRIMQRSEGAHGPSRKQAAALLSREERAQRTLAALEKARAMVRSTVEGTA